MRVFYEPIAKLNSMPSENFVFIVFVCLFVCFLTTLKNRFDTFFDLDMMMKTFSHVWCINVRLHISYLL